MLKELIQDFYSFAKKKLGFKENCKIILKNDLENSKNILGKTGYFDPENNTIVVYTTNRHPKDIARSISHEIIHFWQNCNGKFQNINSSDPQYAQNDPHLREMEKEAYEKGNMLFRDWEDQKKYNNNEGLNEMFSQRNEKLLKENLKKLNKIILKEEKDDEKLKKELIKRANEEGYDEKEFDMGLEVEKEHTDDLHSRSNIAKDHLKEDPKYYTKLKSLNL